MKTTLLFLLITFTLNTQSQTPLQQKYNNYKTRLNNKFVFVGLNAGQSIPLSTRQTVYGADSLNHWGDAGITLGWYIGVLSTEYEIKRRANANYSQTVIELYSALKAINRLDSVAEVYYGGTSNLNGFFLRDDVSPPMIYASNAVNPIFFNSDSCLVSNYACGSSYCLPITSTVCIGSLNNEESQDQFYHLLMGLSFCAKYANITHNGVNLSAEAKNITNRLITYMKQTNWIIKNPITGNDVSRGPNATAYCNGIAKAGLNITGIDYSDATTNGISAQLVWNGFPTINFPVDASSLTNDNVHMFLATAAVANDARASVDNYAVNNGMLIYPLIRQVLYGGPNLINDTVYVNLLDSADTNGNFYYPGGHKSTGGTWYSENMFVWPDRSKASAVGTNTLTFTHGEYHGLDFMLLHNLMELKQQTGVGIQSYESVADVNVYPNPTNGLFTINSNHFKTSTLLIYSMDGKLVFSKSLMPNQTSITINAVGLSNGIYIYKITNDNNVDYKIGKLVIAKD